MPMISLEDCIGMCGLDPDEVAAIGEHEQYSRHRRRCARRLSAQTGRWSGTYPGHDLRSAADPD